MTCGPDHLHADTLTCYTRHKCRCEPCVTRYREYATERRKLKAYGRYERRVDTLGTVRRLHGLQLMGWRYEDVGNLIGMNRRNVRAIQFAGWIAPETRDAVIDATRTLVARGKGPSVVTRKRAEAKGYVPLMSWNNIDNPGDRPVKTPLRVRGEDAARFDPIAVELAASGHRTPLNFREREEVIRILHGRRWPDARIGAAVGCASRQVFEIRKRLGLQGWAYHELATGYGAEHRERGAA